LNQGVIPAENLRSRCSRVHREGELACCSRRQLPRAHQPEDLRVGQDVAQFAEARVVRHPERCGGSRLVGDRGARAHEGGQRLWAVGDAETGLARAAPGRAAMALEKAWLLMVTTPTSRLCARAMSFVQIDAPSP
jgi:hypothetical protein